MRGVTKKWFPDRGYGYITGSDEKDYFVHWSEICMKGRKKLEEGQKVSFDPDKNEKGLIAVGVIPDRAR